MPENIETTVRVYPPVVYVVVRVNVPGHNDIVEAYTTVDEARENAKMRGAFVCRCVVHGVKESPNAQVT